MVVGRRDVGAELGAELVPQVHELDAVFSGDLALSLQDFRLSG